MGTRLLYVEDDHDVRTMLQELLIGEGYDVVALSTAEAALHELEAGRFPLFLTDYNLPNKNADWLLRVAHEKGFLTNTTVIVLSGAVNPRGIDGHQLLVKPVDVDMLLETLEHALRGPLDDDFADTRSADDAPAVILKLYFTGVSSESRRAIRNLRRVLEHFDPKRVRLDIHDVADRRASTTSLDEDRVVVTPTLVRKYPLPKLWILGDLSRIEVVEDMIRAGLAGTQP